jgi:hypothetical protein
MSQAKYRNRAISLVQAVAIAPSATSRCTKGLFDEVQAHTRHVGAEMDQIGFMVRHIDSNGFLSVQNVGGFDTRNLFTRLH